MECEFIINSKEYWQDRFQSGSWVQRQGTGQTEFFMQLLISALPSQVVNDISNNCKSILDWGTALGQGCYELSKAFPKHQIIGLDFAESAIEQAREMYDGLGIEFRTTPLQPGTDRFDCLVTSNVLEHLVNWSDYLDLFTQVAQKYMILLVPFECGVFDEHVVSFKEGSFPEEINGFNKVFEQIIPCDDPRYWTEKQCLLVYVKGV